MSGSPVSAVIELLARRFPQPPVKTTDVRLFHTRVTDTSTPQRFVIVTGGTGERTAESFNGQSNTGRVDIRLTIAVALPAGNPGPQAEWLADACAAALVNERPAVDGKRCSTIRQDLATFMGADEAMANLLSAYYVADFSFTVI